MPVEFWLFWLSGLIITTFFGAYVVRKWRHLGWGVLSVFLAIYIVGANILVPRLIEFNFGPWMFVLVAGSIIWPFTAQITDMINEIYGKRKAYVSAIMAYTANLMFVTFVYMAFYAKPLWDAGSEDFFVMMFSLAPRVLVASIFSYTLANYADINIFSWLKKKFERKEDSVKNIVSFVAIRSATSDAINMVVDNLVFYSIAFYGAMPNEVLLSIIGGSMAAKVILSQIDLPFFVGFRLLTRGVERDY